MRPVAKAIFGILLTVKSACAVELYGVIDTNGRKIIPTEYRAIRYQSKGIFAVTRFKSKTSHGEEVTTFRDFAGKWVDKDKVTGKTQPNWRGSYQVTKVGDALVLVLNGKYALCDSNGKAITQFSYGPIRSLGEGMYLAERKIGDKDHYFVLDGSGNEVCELSSQETVNDPKFSEGLMRIGDRGEPNYYLDHAGKRVIRPTNFFGGGDFSEGLATVDFYSDTSDGAYIDRSGKTVIGPFKSADVGPFINGRGIVDFCHHNDLPNMENHYGVIDRTGRFVIPAEYDYIARYGKDDQFVAEKGNQYFILDLNGNVVRQLPPEFTRRDIHNIPLNEEEPMPFRIGNKYGYRDLSGRVIINPVFDYADPFERDRARVFVIRDGDRYIGLIDKTGNYTVQPAKYGSFDPSENVIIVSIHQNVFSTEEWNENPDRGTSFMDLLWQYNLIGQSTSWLSRFLGEPDKVIADDLPTTVDCQKIICYRLNKQLIRVPVVFIELAIDKESNICAWRPNNKCDWIKENVTLPKWPSSNNALVTNLKLGSKAN